MKKKKVNKFEQAFKDFRQLRNYDEWEKSELGIIRDVKVGWDRFPFLSFSIRMKSCSFGHVIWGDDIPEFLSYARVTDITQLNGRFCYAIGRVGQGCEFKGLFDE